MKIDWKALFLGLVVLAALEIWQLFFNQWLFFGLILVFLLFTYGFYLRKNPDFFKIIFPLLLFSGSFFYNFFSLLVLQKQLVTIFTFILIYLFFSNWHNFPINIRLKGPFFNFLESSSLFLIFVWYSFIFNLYPVLNISVIILLFLILISFIIIFYNTWANEIPRAAGYFYSLLFCLIVAEIFFALSFFPIDISSKSLILVVSFYIYWSLLKLRLGLLFLFKNILPYLIIAFLVLTVIILTTSGGIFYWREPLWKRIFF